MKLARVRYDGAVHLARLDGDEAVLLRAEAAHPAADVLREALASGTGLDGDGRRVEVGAVELLAPVANPSKVIGIGLNYVAHVREAGAEIPKAPLMFVKTQNSIVGPGAAITWAKDAAAEVDYEAELAVVIGTTAWQVEDDPLSYVLGYTCCNDVSARDVQFADGQWVRGKSFDTFCPLGPWVVTADEVPDPQALRIGCDVNGERRQDSTTGDMVFSVAELISYLSRFIRLEPGDVIATGTPPGVGLGFTPPRYLEHDDEVVVWVEGIGSLGNTCTIT